MSGTTAYFLYAIFAIGGAGICFALPRAGRSTRTAGTILALAALALLLVLMAAKGIGQEYPVFFYLFSAVALATAGRVITHPRPVYSALYFVLLVVAVAFLLVLQRAEFLAVALIIIYAGAILVTYAFVIMLAQQAGAAAYDIRSREPFWAVLAGFVTMGAVAGQIDHLPDAALPPAEDQIRLAQAPVQADPAGPDENIGNTEAVGRSLLTTYVITLEVAGVLLLVAIVGAIAIVRKRVPADEVAGEEKPLGQIGKEVPPF